MMNTLRLTSKDFTEKNGRLEYTGKTDVADYDGHIEVEGNLGWVWFHGVKASGNIVIEAGSFIRAGELIEAGERIEAGESIRAGGSISAGWSLEAGGFIEAGGSLEAGGSISAGWSIEAGEFIRAGGSISAGWSIKAGWSLEASNGITAGLAITCTLTLTAGMNVFAGTAPWRKAEGDDIKITCGKFEGGVIAYGELVETGLPVVESESVNPKRIVFEGATYELVEAGMWAGRSKMQSQDNNSYRGEQGDGES